jgi:hypothetical protein
MLSANFVWAVTGAQDAGSEGSGVEECTCSGLDYADGGSYLVDGNSEDEFTFTSVFEGRQSCFVLLTRSQLTATGCFESTITPILVSPDGEGYECSSIDSQAAGQEQRSSWYEKASGWNRFCM